MSFDPFAAFIDLVSMDHRVQASRASLEQKKEYISQLTDSLNVGKRAVGKIEDELHAHKKNADALQLELRAIDDRLTYVRKALTTAGSPKEYFSLEAELKQLSEKQSTIEEQLFAALNTLDKDAQTLVQEQERYKKASHAIHQEVAQVQSLCKELEEIIAHSLQQIESLKPQVNPEVLERFMQMKKKIADPVVPVVDGACSGCFSTVPEKDLYALSRRTLVECKNCFRLLYLPSAV